jgi:hypothetical protein
MNGKHQPHGLEAERQAILERMQMSRDAYRRFLSDDPELQLNGPHGSDHTSHHAISHMDTPHGSAGHHGDRHQLTRFSGTRNAFPRSAAMRWATEHPFLCAAAVAAVVMIGPGRILRTAMKSGTAATALTLRNPSNVDLVSRVLTLVANYARRANPRF